MRATLYPSIKVNKAIKLSGSINLTSLGIHSAGHPYGAPTDTGGGYAYSLWVPINNRMAASNVPNMLVTTQWWKISVKMPILDLSLGTKDSGYGMGLWKSICQRASTSFGLKAKYGPLTITFSPYLGRSDSDWDTYHYRDSSDDNASYRKEDLRDYFRGLSFGVEYQCGPMEAGIIKGP